MAKVDLKTFTAELANELGATVDDSVGDWNGVMRGEMGAGAWLLQFMRAWQHACAAHDAESAVQA